MSQSINLYSQLADHKLFNKNINFNLKRIKLVLKKLNHPEKKLNNVINILGSSGKFSTLFSLKCFIEANSQKVSTYISPSLKDIKERFFMGDKYLTHADISKSIKLIEKLNYLQDENLAKQIGLKNKAHIKEMLKKDSMHYQFEKMVKS